MSVLECAGFEPRGQTTKTGSRKTVAFLLSCSLFLGVLCGCLLAALVFVGKHYGKNTSQADIEKITSKYSVVRLPNDTFPIHYDITLEPNIISGDFQGKVNITIDVTQTRENLIVHSKNLSITEVGLESANSSKIFAVQNVRENFMDDTILVYPNQEVLPGVYYLSFNFTGSLLNKTFGLYRSQYIDKEKKEKRHIATSKFEPTYARQAYPCFDEPNKKAKFTVHLLKPKNVSYTALSNMPEVGSEETDNGILVHFQESVKMSTYLSCFIVSDFKYTENFILPEKDNIPFRVYATPAQLQKTTFARDTGIKVIEYYINYFGIKYPLPKLDMVAIPDFVSGAMEHWGLVTYRETALLYDKSTSSSANKQRVATVVAHELAHSWFGNLVTMNWWNDLWLNEGFASYIEYKGVDAVYKDWQMLDQFLIGDLHPVLSLDATLSSHPIVQTVVTPDQITEIFDTISYNKGAAILRMLEDAVGATKFQTGITNYLNKHKYGNAVTQDLWNELQKIMGDELNVTDFMNTWTMQMGYPILDVKKDGNTFILSQKRFLKDPKSHNGDTSPYNYRWTIPVTYITSEDNVPKYVWFNHSNEAVSITKPLNVKWIKFNYNQVGYYRVNYEESEWKSLIENIKDMSISDKTHLLEESFRIAEAGQLKYDIPLNMALYLKNENNYVPWSVASTVLTEIKNYLTTSEQLAQYKKIIQSIVNPAYEKLTWTESENDDHLKRLARTTVLDLACSFGHADCLMKAKSKFAEWLAGKEVSQDLRSIVYVYGMADGSSDEWDKVWTKFVEENDANEKLKLLKGLASVNDPTLLQKLIQLAKDETYIRSQDYFTCLQYIASTPVGLPLVWDYVRENWQLLVDRFSLNDRYLGRLIPGITKKFTTNVKRDEMSAFFEKYPNAGAGTSARKQALEKVDNNIKWLSKNKVVVENWIVNYKIVP